MKNFDLPVHQFGCTFVDLSWYPDTCSSVRHTRGELVIPGSLMKTGQTTLVILTLKACACVCVRVLVHATIIKYLHATSRRLLT